MRPAPAAARGQHARHGPGHRARRPLAAAALTLLLAACSEAGEPGTEQEPGATSPPAGDATTAPAPPPGDAADRTAPADGEQATADPEDRVVTSRDGAFELERPEGWSDVSGEVPEEIELAIREDTGSGDFFTNLVVASEEPIPDLEQAVEEAAADVAGEDGEHEMLDPTEVAGVPAYGYLVRRSSEGTDIAQVQRWLEHEDRTYVVTFSTAAAQEEEQVPVLEQILDGWTWTE